MLRNILAIVTGFIVGTAVIYLMETIGHWLYATPDINWNDPAAVKDFMGKIPPAALLLVTLAWLLGAFAGAGTAAAIGRTPRPYAAYVVGDVLLASGIYDMIFLPHPLWAMILNLIALVLGTLAGIRFFHKPGKQPPANVS